MIALVLVFIVTFLIPRQLLPQLRAWLMIAVILLGPMK